MKVMFLETEHGTYGVLAVRREHLREAFVREDGGIMFRTASGLWPQSEAVSFYF